MHSSLVVVAAVEAVKVALEQREVEAVPVAAMVGLLQIHQGLAALAVPLDKLAVIQHL